MLSGTYYKECVAGKRRAKRDTETSPWQTVAPPFIHMGEHLGIRRSSVLGGWLYQVVRHIEMADDEIALVDWHPPVFVPGIGSSDGGAV